MSVCNDTCKYYKNCWSRGESLKEDGEDCAHYESDGWVQCSERLPTAEDGERVVVHICFEKPVCEYVYIPWKTVGFEYQVGHIDAWFAIPKYEKVGEAK